jgi:hypothetical protein
LEDGRGIAVFEPLTATTLAEMILGEASLVVVCQDVKFLLATILIGATRCNVTLLASDATLIGVNDSNDSARKNRNR